MTPRDIQLELPELTLAAREWGPADGRPLLALHGWLDNAASFDLLAPRLEGFRTVAVDAAGHGFSDARSADGRYNITHEVGDVFEIVERLGWRRFGLLGHSRGAAVAALFAGTFPERVDALVMIEGGIPILAEPEQAPGNLAEAIAQVGALRGKTGRVFPDRATALSERAGGFSPVSLDAAAMLATRSLREVEGGYRWHADQRLKAKSELYLSGDHMRAFTCRIAAPALAFLASESPFAHRPGYRELLATIPGLAIVDLDGGHHLHMEGGEHEIAARTLRFLARAAGA